MVRALIAKLALGGAAIGAGGGLAGIALANYAESGTFHVYQAPPMRAWSEPVPPASRQQVALGVDGSDFSSGVPYSGNGR